MNPEQDSRFKASATECTMEILKETLMCESEVALQCVSGSELHGTMLAGNDLYKIYVKHTINYLNGSIVHAYNIMGT